MFLRENNCQFVIFAKHVFVMGAFSEMEHSVTHTLVTASKKLSTSQEAMDNRLNEISN